MSLALASRRAVMLPGRWASDPLWRRARMMPSLSLQFAATRSMVDVVSGQNLITFSRLSDATTINSAGQVQTVAAGIPRITHDPATLECLGFLPEEQRVQILELTDALSTQTKTVTAVAHTLSFYGTGTVALSGAHTATVVGTGAYPARTILTFTPASGALTLTVTGTVQFGQLEIGGSATSYIPNSGASSVVRAADVATVTGTNFSSWYRQDEGSMFASGLRFGTADGRFSSFDSGSISNTYVITTSAARNGAVSSVASGVFGGAVITSNSFDFLAPIRLAVALSSSGNEAISLNGGAVATGAVSPPSASLTTMRIGVQENAAAWFNGPIARLDYWPRRLPDSILQELSR